MISATKPVWRKVHSDRGEYAVAITPHGVLVREKGRRQTLLVPTDALFDLSVKLEAMRNGIEIPQRRVIRGGKR